jgi:ectoine hydroxylase-related dioxygenase (phytanoyl-CoA dioxygenase family)
LFWNRFQNDVNLGRLNNVSDSEYFAEHGYLIKERLFSDADLDRIQVALDELTDLATRAPEDSDRFKFSIFGHGGDRRQVQQVADPHEFGGAFIALGRDPRILDLVEELLGPNVLLYYSMLMMKPPAGGAASPWHQDLAFYTHDRARLVNVQVYLDAATRENGCVRVVPGSHREGLRNHYDGELHTGVVQGDTRDFDAREVLVEVPAGSIAVWHSLTMHSSHPNNSDRPRRAIAFGYKDPSTALLSGSFNASETRQVGMIVRGVDPRGQLLSAL